MCDLHTSLQQLVAVWVWYIACAAVRIRIQLNCGKKSKAEQNTAETRNNLKAIKGLTQT